MRQVITRREARTARSYPTEMTELDGGSSAAVADHYARGRVSTAQVSGTVVWLNCCRGGKIGRVEGYVSRDEALAAVGLRA
jgi:hypothetical protein